SVTWQQGWESWIEYWAKTGFYTSVNILTSGFWSEIAAIWNNDANALEENGAAALTFLIIVGLKKLPGCFLAGTPVATEQRQRPIEQIRRGDRVWGYNFQTGDWRLCEVLEPVAHEYDGDIITVEAGEEKIESSGNHPFWVLAGEALALRPAPEYVPV